MESSPFGNTDILTGGLPLGLVVGTSGLSSTVSSWRRSAFCCSMSTWFVSSFPGKSVDVAGIVAIAGPELAIGAAEEEEELVPGMSCASGGASKTLSPLISYGLPLIYKRSCWSYRSLGMVRLKLWAFTMPWRVPKMCMSSWLSRPSHTPKFQLDLNLHLMGPVSRKITVSPKGTTWLGYSLSMCLAKAERHDGRLRRNLS